jgi:hypothetical protein
MKKIALFITWQSGGSVTLFSRRGRRLIARSKQSTMPGPMFGKQCVRLPEDAREREEMVDAAFNFATAGNQPMPRYFIEEEDGTLKDMHGTDFNIPDVPQEPVKTSEKKTKRAKPAKKGKATKYDRLLADAKEVLPDVQPVAIHTLASLMAEDSEDVRAAIAQGVKDGSIVEVKGKTPTYKLAA